MVTPLHNFSPAKIELKKEDYQDRMICLLKAQNFTPRRIADMLGVSKVKVLYTLRQPFAQKTILEILHAKGEPAVENLLKGACTEAIEVMEQLMREARSESVRASCAFEFIKAHKGTKLVVE